MTPLASALKINITGSNDAPVISSAVQSGSVTEDGALTASGQVTSTDVDHDATATYSGSAAGTYGAFAVAANGAWTYTLDNAAHQSLSANDTLSETFTVTVTDDQGAMATQDVTITVNGTNDGATISGTATGSVTEDGGLTASGTLAVADVDDAQAGFQTPAPLAGAHGSFSFNAATGAWGYLLNNGDAAVQALGTGDSLTDTLTVTSIDGTATQDIVVTINGANEPVTTASTPPVFTGTGDPNDFDNATGAPTGGITCNADIIVGTAGPDSTNSQGGNDIVYAGVGNDTLSGQGGSDTLYGQAGNDNVDGNNDNDTLYGGSGNDTINGNNNDDTLYGGSGADTINGGGDNDTIIGGYGADTLTGAGGTDKFVYLSLNDTGDHITDFVAGGVAPSIERLDFSAIDADSATVANEAFVSATLSTSAVAHGINYFQSGLKTSSKSTPTATLQRRKSRSRWTASPLLTCQFRTSCSKPRSAETGNLSTPSGHFGARRLH